MSASNDNRRLKPRYSATIQVEMITQGLNHLRAERTANISTGGLFLCTPYQGKIGETVHLRVILSDKDAFFDVKSRVAWICDGEGSHPQGIGVEFIELSPEQDQIVQRILKGYVNVQRS